MNGYIGWGPDNMYDNDQNQVQPGDKLQSSLVAVHQSLSDLRVVISKSLARHISTVSWMEKLSHFQKRGGVRLNSLHLSKIRSMQIEEFGTVEPSLENVLLRFKARYNAY